MLGLAVLLLLIAIAAYAFGAREAGSIALTVAKWCLIVFVILVILSFLVGGPYGGWPFYSYGRPVVVY